MAIVDHLFIDAPKRHIGMLLPLGEHKHAKIISECEIGDVVSDPEGNEAEIIAMSKINADTQIADCIALQLYGKPIKVIKEHMEKRWRLADNELIYLIVKPL